jgi:recombination endonuclease VII
MTAKFTINYHKMSKEEKKAYHQEYYQKHKEEMKSKANENYHANREDRLKQQKERYQKNRERYNARNRKYYKEHREEARQTAKAYIASHKKEIREHRLKRDYGISSEDYEQMLFEQKGLCAICNLPSDKPLYIDHDHKTKKVRQLLCSKCNLALGYVNDCINILQSMIKYLKKHKQEKEK